MDPWSDAAAAGAATVHARVLKLVFLATIGYQGWQRSPGQFEHGHELALAVRDAVANATGNVTVVANGTTDVTKCHQPCQWHHQVPPTMSELYANATTNVTVVANGTTVITVYQEKDTASASSAIDIMLLGVVTFLCVAPELIVSQAVTNCF